MCREQNLKIYFILIVHTQIRLLLDPRKQIFHTVDNTVLIVSIVVGVVGSIIFLAFCAVFIKYMCNVSWSRLIFFQFKISMCLSLE